MLKRYTHHLQIFDPQRGLFDAPGNFDPPKRTKKRKPGPVPMKGRKLTADKKRLAARIARSNDWDPRRGRTKPGSMNRHKSFPAK